MRNEIYKRLLPITWEEKKLLANGGAIDKTIYNKRSSSVIDSSLLLTEGKLIEMRTHTRFVHFPRHSHNYVEMVYMVSGTTRHLVNGNEVVLRAGELLLMNQHATQEIYEAGETDIAVNFVILPEFFDTTLSMIGSSSSFIRDFLIDCLRSSSGHVDYLHFQVADVIQIQNLLENLIINLIDKVPHTRLLNQNTVGLLFLHLMQHTDQLTLGGDRLEDEIIMKVYSQIEDHYRDGELSDLCDEFDMDLYGLSRIIKRKTGKNYTDLLQEKRLTRASYLLETTGLPITDICADVGYNNFSYFYKLFRNKYGMTPKEYRKRI